MTRIRQNRKRNLARMIERLCSRSLLAADLSHTIDLLDLSEPLSAYVAGEDPAGSHDESGELVNGHVSIPLEPAEMVERERAYYSSLASAVAAREVPLSDTFLLHSRPTATKTIYLDFDGNITIGTAWNRAYNVQTITSPAYDPDRNGPSFTNNELQRIQGIWQRVAADFAPFDVNVTTQDPGVQALVNTGGSDTRWGMRVVMTVDNFANSGAGGFAYINSFNWGFESQGATDTPCFVFNTTEVSVAAAISHEVGHSLGLSHDGTNATHPSQPSSEYYNGHGTGETSWGPIMGVGGYYSNVTTWDLGEYFGTSNGAANANYGRGPDDISIMTNFNGFGTLSDRIGDTLSTATTVNYLGTNLADPNLIDVSVFGTVETRADVDMIRFETGDGLINLTIDPYVVEAWVRNSGGGFDRVLENVFYGTFWANNQGTNLDVEARLYNASGTLIATSNPTGLRASFSNLALSAGVYYIGIDGVGFSNPRNNPPIGYTDYGSIGQYLVSGTVRSLGVSLDLGSGTASYTENTDPIAVAPAAVFRDSPFLNYDLLNLSVSIISNGEASDRLSIISTGSGPGQIGVVGNQIRYGGVPFATFVQSGSQLTIDFASTSTQQSVEALIRNIAYASVSDGPATLPRRIQMTFGLGTAATRDVRIIPVNDSPSLVRASLATIDEDSPNPAGQEIGFVLASIVSDPDVGASVSGIAVVRNMTDPNTEGTWFYSSDFGLTWAEIGFVDDRDNSLLIAATNLLGFKPAKDFFGSPTPLKVRVLDNTFAGVFSDSTGEVRRFLPNAVRNTVNGPVAVNTGDFGASVRNINDAPFANTPIVNIRATQDVPVNFRFNSVHPDGLFSDVDSTDLTWVLRPILLDMPSWINFDPVAKTLTGTPSNFDVGVTEFQLTATDSDGLSVTVPLTLSVANVNDPPQIIDISSRTIVENELGAIIGKVTTFDPDPFDQLNFTVSDNRFVINGDTLALRPSAFINFELEPQVIINIIATDNGTPSISTTKSFTLEVIDKNEFFPTLSTQDLVIPFVRTNNQTIADLDATDEDTQQIVRFRIDRDDASIFEINTDTGVLRLKSGANVTAQNYQLFIAAYDNGTPVNARTVLFNASVEVPNQFSPNVITGLTQSVQENAAGRTQVGFVRAFDADGDTRLTYAITSTQFNINSATGELTVRPGANLDFETQSRYIVPLEVTDSGSPSRTSSFSITITLTNTNDAPTAIALSNPNVLAQINGLPLSPIQVTDQDIAAQYLFSTTDARFEVRNGRLALRSTQHLPQNLAGTRSTVQVTVTDAADPTVSATLPLSFNIVSNPLPWQNPVSRFDVNADGNVTALDALLVINALNSPTRGRGPLNVPRDFAQLPQHYLDTSGDNQLSALDALQIINHLNTRRSPGVGEGESTLRSATRTPAPRTAIDHAAWYDAFTSLERERRRRA